MVKRKQQVQVKSYRRRDGTVVRSSNRAVLTVGKDVRKEKRQNKLGNYLKTGAKIGGALGGAVGGLSGAAAGGMVLGPAGALAGAGIYGASGALGGAVSGSGYGAATYAARKKFAKDKSKRNFDYEKGNLDNMYEFAKGKVGGYSYNTKTKKIKTPKTRKREKQYKTAGLVGGGLAGAALTGAAILNRKKIGSAITRMKTPKLPGSKPKLLGAGPSFSRINTNLNGESNMFIGQIEKEGYSYDFARKRGSKDRKKRQSRGMSTGKKVGVGVAGAAALGGLALAAGGPKNSLKAIQHGVRVGKSRGVGRGLATAGRIYGKGVKKNAAAVGNAAKGAANSASTFKSRVRNTIDKKRRMGPNSAPKLSSGGTSVGYRGNKLPAGR